MSEAVGAGEGYSLLKLTPAHLQALGQLLPAENAAAQVAEACRPLGVPAARVRAEPPRAPPSEPEGPRAPVR